MQGLQSSQTKNDEEAKRESERVEREALKLLGLARIFVKKKAPYLMRTLRKLIPYPAHGLGTLAVTDTMVLLYDPVTVATEPEFSELDTNGLPHKLAGVLAHECMHVIRDTERIFKLAKVDKKKANIAADLPINEDLRSAGWSLPSFGVFLENYGFPRGLAMEQYFQMLLQEEGSENKCSGKVTGGGCGGVAGNPGDSSAEQKAAQQAAAEGYGRSKAEKANTKRDTLKAAARHHQAGRGDAPGWIKEELNYIENQKPERDWERELSHVVRQVTGARIAGGSDFSLARPSKRSIVYGFPRPGLVDYQPSIYSFWDTSGSMGTEQLNKCRQVVLEIMGQMGIDEMFLGQGDTRIVRDFERVNVQSIKTMSCDGRGGTDFRPLFTRLETVRPKPDVLLVITDGDGPAPPEQPLGLSVVWVIVPSHFRRKPTTWGHYVICSNDHGVVDGFQ